MQPANMTPEEFAELSVPFIDIDPRFNFWNLPANAKVLLVSNMPEAITKPLEVFNLFRYGHSVFFHFFTFGRG